MVTGRFILLGLVVAQIADAVTFSIGVTRLGIEYEANGIAAELFRLGGMDAVLVFKAAAIVTIVCFLALTAQRFPRVLYYGGAAATSLGLLGFVANTTSVLLST